MINLPFLRETHLLASKSQVSQVTYHQQSQLGAWVACMCYDLQWQVEMVGWIVSFSCRSRMQCLFLLRKSPLPPLPNLHSCQRRLAPAARHGAAGIFDDDLKTGEAGDTSTGGQQKITLPEPWFQSNRLESNHGKEPNNPGQNWSSPKNGALQSCNTMESAAV